MKVTIAGNVKDIKEERRWHSSLLMRRLKIRNM